MEVNWWIRVFSVLLLISGACYLDSLAHRRTLTEKELRKIIREERYY